MFWLIIFLFGALCAVICVSAFVVWLVTGVLITLLNCVEKSLLGFGSGHVITGAVYLVPATMLLCALVQFVCLAISFGHAVLK